ncbi:MAG: glyoxylate/hydroxypyruvate reductase A [Betaproteobacteria bacterium]|nr:MAG: glyoxylate/hydroxypyruvate reductase A [Betaproteobacteria bacterium]
MRIHISTPIDEAAHIAAMFQEALPEAHVALVDGTARDSSNPVDADYVVTGYRNATLFDRERRMKAIFAFSAGVGHVLSLPNLPRDVPVIRLEDAGMASQMVRYVLAATLRFAQRLDVYARQQRDRRWQQMPPRAPRDIHVGVLGIGVIGSEIARSLASFGFAVRGFARQRRAIAGVRCLAGEGEFHGFLDGLDVLVAVVALTPENTGILNRATLSRLADAAHVINIGRGAHLVEADLLALIDEGKLSGATLDVFHDEPLPEDHPFWGRPEILITPHIAGTTLPQEAVEQIAAKIKRLERGLPVTGVVDRERGY